MLTLAEIYLSGETIAIVIFPLMLMNFPSDMHLSKLMGKQQVQKFRNEGIIGRKIQEDLTKLEIMEFVPVPCNFQEVPENTEQQF